jgi:hypothetical protein
MSFEAAAWAINQQTKTQSAKLVLIGLSDCHNRDTGKCDPGNQYLMRIAQCSPRAINNAIAELEDLGLIEASRDPGRRTEYRLNIGKSSATVALAQPVRGRNQCGGVAQPLRGGSALCDIPFSIEPGRNQEGTRKEIAAAPSKKSLTALDWSSWPTMPSAQVMADWVAARKAKRAPISQTVIGQFGNELHKAAALGYSVDQCLAECITSGWQGFKAAWIANRNKTGGTNGQSGRPDRESVSARAVREAAEFIADLDAADRAERCQADGSGGFHENELALPWEGVGRL